MNTEHIEKFVNAIACDLEEGGFRQVSGTTLRRSLTEAVSAALPLLETGNPVPALAEQQGVNGVEKAAIELWHRFANEGAGEWSDEIHKAEYRLAAKAVIHAWLRDVRITQEMLDAGLDALLGYRKSGGDYRVHPSHATEAAIKAALAATGKQQVGEESAGLPEMCRSSTNAQAKQVGEVQGDARSQFEAWQETFYTYPLDTTRHSDGHYQNPVTQGAFAIWKAALASRQPVGQEPVVEFQARLMDVKTNLPVGNWCHSPTFEENPGRGTHYWVQYRTRYIYYTPPAHAVDLGQFNALAALANAIVHHRGESPMKNGVFAEAERLLALIDQRDAAPGVGS